MTISTVTVIFDLMAVFSDMVFLPRQNNSTEVRSYKNISSRPNLSLAYLEDDTK